MTIQNQLVPIMSAEFDNSNAQQGPSLLKYKCLLVGQKLKEPAAWAGTHVYAVGDLVKPTVANGHWYLCVLAGTSGTEPSWPTTVKGEVAEGTNKPTWREFKAPTASALTVNLLSGKKDDTAAALFGQGSLLHVMAKGWAANNSFNEIYAVAMEDAGAAVAASGTIVFAGTASASGTIALYIDGKRITVGVTSGDVAATVAAAVCTAINRDYSLPVLASISSATVTLTAKNKGDCGNDIDIQTNYNIDEMLPTGITATITAMASGATNPDITDVLDILGETWNQIIVGPYTDATNIAAIETECESREGSTRMIYTKYYTARRGDVSAHLAFSSARNSKWVTCVNSNKYPSSSWEYIAGIAGQVAASASADPAVPFKTLPVNGILPPKIVDRLDNGDNETLLNAGISTTYADDGGVVRIQQIVTMYRHNPTGADDVSYQFDNTIFNLMYQSWDFRTSLANKFPRAKLMNDGVKVGPGQSIITPKIGKAFAVEKYAEWEYLGLVENAEEFEKNIVCVRSTTSVNRLDWLLPPDLANQFNQAAVVIQFIS